MTDEKLEELLQQALCPVIRDEETRLCPSARRYKMKKKWIQALSVAACLIFLIGAGCVQHWNLAVKKETKTVNHENTFTLLVDTKGNGSDNWSVGKNADGYWYYNVDLPFSCQGNHIEEVTYRVNQGGFQVVGDTGIVIDGTEISQMNVGEDDKQRIKTYSEFSLAYDNQTAEGTKIQLVYDKGTADSSFFSEENGSVEERKTLLKNLLKGVVIICQVTYSDGSTGTIEVQTENIVSGDLQLKMLADESTEEIIISDKE